MSNQDPRELRQIAEELKANGMRCNCDLDNWQPERSTGHSCVCRIHKTSMELKFHPKSKQAAVGA
jgi:hypothetical protein